MIDRGKHNILGVRVDAVDYAAAVERIAEATVNRRPLAVSALAVHGIMTGVLDSVQRIRLNNFDLVVPDGQPVRWALNLLHGTRLRERVYGPTLMLQMCEWAAAHEAPIFLFGGTADQLAALGQRLLLRFPGLRIAGNRPSAFRRLTAAERDQLVAEIRGSGAALTFVGLGCPRQEVWAYENREALSMPLLAVGAAFAFHAGQLSQAPRFLQDRGMEWFYRMVREPRRLWKRYALLNPLYLALLLAAMDRPAPLRARRCAATDRIDALRLTRTENSRNYMQAPNPMADPGAFLPGLEQAQSRADRRGAVARVRHSRREFTGHFQLSSNFTANSRCPSADVERHSRPISKANCRLAAARLHFPAASRDSAAAAAWIANAPAHLGSDVRRWLCVGLQKRLADPDGIASAGDNSCLHRLSRQRISISLRRLGTNFSSARFDRQLAAARLRRMPRNAGQRIDRLRRAYAHASRLPLAARRSGRRSSHLPADPWRKIRTGGIQLRVSVRPLRRSDDGHRARGRSDMRPDGRRLPRGGSIRPIRMGTVYGSRMGYGFHFSRQARGLVYLAGRSISDLPASDPTHCGSASSRTPAENAG